MSTENVEYFMETTDITQYWYKEPRYRYDLSVNNMIATLIEDNEHYDEPKTQHIHRDLHRLMSKFPDMPAYARAMLDRFANSPTSKPLCFMSRQNPQDHLDYDIAH